jgi:hypothetical protein
VFIYDLVVISWLNIAGIKEIVVPDLVRDPSS